MKGSMLFIINCKNYEEVSGSQISKFIKIAEKISKKYMEFMESTLDQITSSMDLDFDTILGKPKQTGLDEYFWN